MFKTQSGSEAAGVQGRENAETIIGPSVKVEGDFSGDGNVIVEGVVMGSLTTQKNLSVTETAKITADVEAQNALIAGEINGNLTIHEKLEIAATAKVHGDVQAKILSITPGAVLNGRCSVASDVKPRVKQAKEELLLELKK